MPDELSPAEQFRSRCIEISVLTAEEFDDLRAGQMARQVDVPKVGSVAPDFKIDVLDRQRKRTGDQLQLSSLRGKPVGLIFGSWT